MNNPQIRITWKAAGLLLLALGVTYLGTQVIRDAAKETGISAAILAMLVGATAHRLPELPEQT